jgi:heme exporter protein D
MTRAGPTVLPGILCSVTTGWNNQQAIDKVNRTLKGGSSGRVAVLLIAAAFLALGIYAGNLWLCVPFGIATAVAAWAVVVAGRNDLAARRMERRGLARK